MKAKKMPPRAMRNLRKNEALYDCIIMDLTLPGVMGDMETLNNSLAIDSDARAMVSSG
tara:strand:- start:264 stop:437 length:174 start_codon:yes stop_codon:yes gene_type:complete